MICDALSTDCANSQVLYWFLFSSSLASLVLTFRLEMLVCNSFVG
jgi:hypothetical protein